MGAIRPASRREAGLPGLRHQRRGLHPDRQRWRMRRETGLYLVGFNRRDVVKGVRDTALTLNACDYKGINRNQTGNAMFVDLTAGHPKEEEQIRSLRAAFLRDRLSCGSQRRPEAVRTTGEAAIEGEHRWRPIVI